MSALLRPLAPWLALAALVAVLLLAGPATCRAMRAAEADARLRGAQGGAAVASGSDAVETVGRAATRERQSADLDQTNQREIHHAQGANAPIADSVTAAGLDGLCRRAAYRDSERCRLRGAAAR